MWSKTNDTKHVIYFDRCYSCIGIKYILYKIEYTRPFDSITKRLNLYIMRVLERLRYILLNSFRI